MNIRSNRYNDPALGEAFNNIASIFAPPSAQDMAGYATANAKKEEAARLSQLFEAAGGDFDRMGMATGQWNPTQSFYAQNQNNATTIRGQDVVANTSITNNTADNARALATNAADNERAVATNLTDNRFKLGTQFMTPLGQGQVQPGLPADIAGLFGVPELPRTEGQAKPLSETEVRGGERLDLRESGMLTDDMLLDEIFGSQTPVKTVGPDGGAVFSTPGAAARSNAPAYIDAGSQAKPTNGMAVLANGQRVPAIQDVTTGVWKHAQTGEVLPPDVQVFDTPSPTGSLEEVGVGKPVANNIDRQLIDVAVAKDTAVTLRDMIAASPASQGAVGWLRGTTQNVVQTGGELGAFFGGQMQEVSDAIASGAADANLAGAFDPSLPAIEMMANLLAFQYAKTTTGERLSNEMLRASRAALGLEGLTANQASSLARIDQAISQMESQEAILRRIRTEGTGGGQSAPAPGAPAAITPPAGPQPGEVVEGYRFIGGDPAQQSSWEKVQ